MKFNKKDKEAFEEMAKKDKLSFKDKIKSQGQLATIMGGNMRLFLKANRLNNRLARAKKKCPDCCKKIDELSNPKYSDKQAHQKILDGYFCKNCTPPLKDYFEFMMNIKPSDVKI
jgi:uncharacterized protein with PIN domain